MIFINKNFYEINNYNKLLIIFNVFNVLLFCAFRSPLRVYERAIGHGAFKHDHIYFVCNIVVAPYFIIDILLINITYYSCCLVPVWRL